MWINYWVLGILTMFHFEINTVFSIKTTRFDYDRVYYVKVFLGS